MKKECDEFVIYARECGSWGLVGTDSSGCPRSVSGGKGAKYTPVNPSLFV